MKLNLNIGCGEDYKQSTDKEKWINIDIRTDVKTDLMHPAHLLHEKFENQVDFILTQDVLEHIEYHKDCKTLWLDTLKSWIRCLKINEGIIRIQVPSIQAIFQKLQTGWIDEEEMNNLIFGWNMIERKHYQLFSIGRLKTILRNLDCVITYEEQLNICAIVEARRIV
jgi:predicted SAM-dependent methyltransferase